MHILQYKTGTGTEIIEGTFARTLLNPNDTGTSASDDFGWSIDTNGEHVVVGAPMEDTGGNNAGVVYVFAAATGSLVETIENPEPTTAADDQFGYSVAISPSGVIAIGAPFSNDIGGGTVYLYSTGGTLLDTIYNPQLHGWNNDQFGRSVALSDSHLVVGCPGDEGATHANAGKVFVYFVGSANEMTILNNPNLYGGELNDQFGWSVDIDDNVIIVGCHEEDTGGYLGAGAAYIFQMTGTISTLTASIPNPTPATTDHFGWSVGVYGSSAVVGARYKDAPSADRGQAFVYNLTGSLQQTINCPTDVGGENFGNGVDIYENNIVIGAPGAAGGGITYVYNTSGTLLHTLTNPNDYGGTTGDRFGEVVAISKDYVIVTAIDEDDASGSSSGKVYIFD